MQQIGILLSTYAKRIKPRFYYARSLVHKRSFSIFDYFQERKISCIQFNSFK